MKGSVELKKQSNRWWNGVRRLRVKRKKTLKAEAEEEVERPTPPEDTVLVERGN